MLKMTDKPWIDAHNCTRYVIKSAVINKDFRAEMYQSEKKTPTIGDIILRYPGTYYITEYDSEDIGYTEEKVTDYIVYVKPFGFYDIVQNGKPVFNEYH